MDQEKVWDEIAPSWNEFRKKVPPTVEKFLANKTGKILDIGCGSGRNFIKKTDLEWVAVDFSEEMVKYAKKRAEDLGVSVEVIKSDSVNLPFEDDTFDSVLCFAMLHCVENPLSRKKTLQEIYRVLKKGGAVLISSWGPKSPRLKNKPNECFISWSSNLENSLNRYTYVFQLDELRELCEVVGFKIIHSWEERNVNVIAKKL
jgi:ubiquinone/menaquinone biosynthesis C-methylase UbiE